MRKLVAGFVAAVLAGAAGAASDLSAVEMRWLQGAWPVLIYARESKLPLDIVVQPRPVADAPPLALAFIGGRCKLVFTMRDNPEVQATMDRIEPSLLDATLELMAAHELGHCRRYLDGAWHGLPTGFVASPPSQLPTELRAAWADMKAARLEEGYADLVGLAWSQRQHPQQYAKLQAWLVAERSAGRLAGSHHDTLAWVRRAAQGAAWAAPTGAAATSIFDAAAALWAAGLADDE
jgi:hypothetical protein